MEILEKEMQEDGKEYVYLAEFVGGFCKIGVSKNPKKRLRNIQSKNQIPVKRYFLVEGYFELENILHRHFKEKRRYSEWFDIEFEELICFVKKINYFYNPKNKESERKEKQNNTNMFIGLYKQIEENPLTFKKEGIMEMDFVTNIQDKSFFIIWQLENKKKVCEKKIKELMQYIIYYNNFLEKIKIKIGEEEEIIRDNILLLKELLKIATFIEFTDTNGMSDKEIYAMVKSHIEK